MALDHLLTDKGASVTDSIQNHQHGRGAEPTDMRWSRTDESLGSHYALPGLPVLWPDGRDFTHRGLAE